MTRTSQNKTNVLSGGTYKSVPIDSLDKGEYGVLVVMPVAFLQTKSIQQLIGDKGQMLTGPLVFDIVNEARRDPQIAADLEKQAADNGGPTVGFGNTVRVESMVSVP